MSGDGTDLRTRGRRAEIVKLTVYHLAILLFTETALSGENLESHSETERFESADPALIEDALARIDRAAPSAVDGSYDARWGLVFTAASGERITALYLNRFGTRGELDGRTVTLADESLIDWLREKYGADSVLS